MDGNLFPDPREIRRLKVSFFQLVATAPRPCIPIWHMSFYDLSLPKESVPVDLLPKRFSKTIPLYSFGQLATSNEVNTSEEAFFIRVF